LITTRLRPAPLVVTTRRQLPGDVHKLQLPAAAGCNQSALLASEMREMG